MVPNHPTGRQGGEQHSLGLEVVSISRQFLEHDLLFLFVVVIGDYQSNRNCCRVPTAVFSGDLVSGVPLERVVCSFRSSCGYSAATELLLFCSMCDTSDASRVSCLTALRIGPRIHDMSWERLSCGCCESFGPH